MKESYTRKTLPFLKSEYFTNEVERNIFNEIRDFTIKYNNLPTADALKIEVDSLRNLTADQARDAAKLIDDLQNDNVDTNIDWLIDSTEKFCQEKAIYNAIMQSIDIMNNKGGALTKGAIPDLLTQALAISFDPNVGHDYLEDFEERYEYYHRVEHKIPFDLDFFNKITKNGFSKKTLNIFLAGTGVGKSLTMCHIAAAALAQGKNVLYITLELAEEEVAKRIDANLMNITIDDLLQLPQDLYMKKAAVLKNKSQGKLIVKEYPTASASTLHFKALLNELHLKKSFQPDIIFVDYLNICASARIKPGGNVNSYTYIKAIAEELRGLAVEFEVPLVSATQTNRTGFTSTDVGLEDTSESFGLPATADFMAALISTEQLQELNQIMVKQLKNRYADPATNKRFVIGIDRAKMKLYDVEQSAQVDIVDSGQKQGADDKMVNRMTNKFKSLKV
jgi:replicative DNA helicase